ncbi:hydrogenase formation protein HypD [Arachidicoccus ginsenosidimutans]|uniref:hydrogenase formation protein HypD n=1 Tax=Arachidicoccus sp. BS20 TaxID=1850526 RepID=UPI0007F13F77|nr:hydrogenase formation protein HypD [Arachidicoccus sp. BS20]ANI87880.1 hydrogenase formation protein HypD [Arachidicoccus sp. BS20]
MKYLTEYRDADVVEKYINELHKITTQHWNIMEVCGGQTHSLVKNGLLSMMPDKINMIHGPGCPVCVTPLNLIDKAIYLAEEKNVILCSFGDMLRVPGSKKSLLEAKANGADVRILYSPLEAVKIAKDNPNREVVFFAVGFETTAPANALSVLHAAREGLKNYSILTSHVLVPPAMEAILSDDTNIVQGFLGAGHVCTIMGLEEYYPIVENYKTPIVVTGFEPVDLLQGIVMLIKQLEKGEYKLENQYSRVVNENGNEAARNIMEQVFETSSREWRGIGTIPYSGFDVKKELEQFDANKKFTINIPKAEESKECIAGEVLRGKKKPNQCPMFGTKCTPTFPLGAPMVSSEGACAAYYHFSQAGELQEA